MAHLFPEHVPHGGVDGPRPLPGPRQLVLRRRPLVAVQGSHHVARAEQGTAAVREQWLSKGNYYNQE